MSDIRDDAQGLSFTVKTLELRQIKRDDGLQCRLKTSQAGIHRIISMIRYEGVTFRPIDVFFDGTDYWLANGYHRCGAYDLLIKGGDDSYKNIKARVFHGTREDAIAFGAGANKEFLVPMTKEDKENAVIVLLKNKQWEIKSTSTIASHVGVGNRFVDRVKARYYNSIGQNKPAFYVGSNGVVRPANFKRQKQSSLGHSNPSEDQAASGLKNHPNSFVQLLTTRGFYFKSIFQTGFASYAGLWGLSGHRCVLIIDRSPGLTESQRIPLHSIVRLVGAVTLARAKCGQDHRAIIVGRPEDQHDAAKPLIAAAGIEYLTIDSLIASLEKAKQAEEVKAPTKQISKPAPVANL